MTATRKLLDHPLLVEEIGRELASRHLLDFVKQAFAVVEPGNAFVPGWHIEVICEHLEAVTRGRIRNLLINMPPRHMKSLLVSVFWPCWEWIEHPERRWLYASYAENLSRRDSVKCRRLLQSEWYQRRWGDRFHLTEDQNEKQRFDTDRGGCRLALSVMGSVTGEGGDRVVCDDPHNVGEAESAVKRRAVCDWWGQVMSTRGNDPRQSARVIVMQRCHEQDLSGHVLAQGGWEHLCLPAEYEGEPAGSGSLNGDRRSRPGELLWPARFGRREVNDLKRSLGSYGAAGQLQQRPAPAGGGLLKRHWWRYWQTEEHGLPPVEVRNPEGQCIRVPAVNLPQRFDQVLQSWDMAFKDGDGTDFVVGQVWGRQGADKYLLDQVRRRMDFPATLDAIRGLSAKWPSADLKLVEDKANGSAVIASLQHELGGMVPVTPEGGKQSRASAISPEVEAGNYYLPHPGTAAWVEDFIQECATFPRGAHDDQVDAWSQAGTRFLAPTPQIFFLDD